MKPFYIIIIFFLFCIANANAQFYEYEETDYDTTNVNEDPIDIYDKFNPVLEGDSVRWKGPGNKYTGSYEEYYTNGKIKHKGYYNNGQLTTTYKNYFDNGQMERSFKMIDVRSCQMEIFYKNGVLRSNVKYFNGQALSWTDYYSNGKMEYYEEYDKSFEYYIKMNYYFKSGNPQSTFELQDKKNKIYDSKEYWENGNLKQEGKMIFNKSISDYQKDGTWILYDKTAVKIGEEDYVKGQLNDERKF